MGASNGAIRCSLLTIRLRLACGLPQRRVDAVLPARAVLLKVFEDVAIDAQGDRLLGTGKRRLARDRFRRLGGRRLEGGLGHRAWIVGSTGSIGVHGIRSL